MIRVCNENGSFTGSESQKYDSHLKKKLNKNQNQSPCHSKVASRLERKQQAAGVASLWLFSGSFVQSQTPNAFAIGDPQIHSSFSGRKKFHLCQLRLFCGHYFISHMAKLPLLADNRIIQKVLFPLLILHSQHFYTPDLNSNLSYMLFQGLFTLPCGIYHESS